MIWIDQFDSLFAYFDFDWLKSDRDSIVHIENNHVETPRPHGYLVPRITKAERKTFRIAAENLRNLHATLAKATNI